MSTVTNAYDVWASRIPTDQARVLTYTDACGILRRRLDGNTESARTWIQLQADILEAWTAMTAAQRFGLLQPTDILAAFLNYLKG